MATVPSATSTAASAVVVRKVAKMVKSLQTCGFMSSEHVLNVLKDCAVLVQGNSEMQWELGQSQDGVPALVQIMNRFEDSVAVQDISCAILCDLCIEHDENRLWVASQGGLQAVLVALLKHEKAMTVQIQALRTLAILSMNETNKLLIPEMNGLEVLQTCMEAYVDNIAVQIQACRVVSELAQVPANARALAALRLTNTVLKTMQQNHFEHQQRELQQEQKNSDGAETTKRRDKDKTSDADDESLQYHACAAVWALTAESELNRGQMAGVLPYVLVAMKNYASNPSLQAIACGALWNLTMNHPVNANEIVSYDYEQGIRILLTTMKQHPSDPNVQEAACAVLKNLTMTEEHATLVGHAGAIAPILNAMRQHEDSQGVQVEGCSALCNLAMAEDHKAPILNAGGIGMIVFAMRQALEGGTSNDSSNNAPSSSYRDGRREEVQKHACKALNTLAMDNEQNKISIAASGGLAAILLAMDRYPESAGLQVLAVRALFVLAEIPRNRTTIASHCGISTIRAALNNHPFETYLDEAVPQLLSLLSDPGLSNPQNN